MNERPKNPYHNMWAKETIETAHAITVLLRVSMPKQATTKALLQAQSISYNPITPLK